MKTQSLSCNASPKFARSLNRRPASVRPGLCGNSVTRCRRLMEAGLGVICSRWPSNVLVFGHDLIVAFVLPLVLRRPLKLT